jgi:hypothetical protein
LQLIPKVLDEIAAEAMELGVRPGKEARGTSGREAREKGANFRFTVRELSVDHGQPRAPTTA